MDYNLVGKVRFCVHGHYIETFTEFLAAFPQIKLSLLEQNEIEKQIAAFSIAINNEFQCGYIFEDQLPELTLYISSLVHVDKDGNYYLVPLDHIHLFFRGFRVICFYDIAKSA